VRSVVEWVSMLVNHEGHVPRLEERHLDDGPRIQR
jgi:hypothetical protein